MIELLAGYGFTVLFTEQYRRYLTDMLGADEPLGGQLLKRLPVPWNRKPWTCPLCLSGWATAGAWILSQVPGHLFDFVLYGFAGIAVAHTGDAMIRYLRMEDT